MPSEPITSAPCSARLSRFLPACRLELEESRLAEEHEGCGRLDGGYVPREPLRLSQASGASFLASVSEEDRDRDRQLGESRDQVGRLRETAEVQIYLRRGSHPEHVTLHPGRSRFVEMFDGDADEDRVEDDDEEGEGEGQRTPTSPSCWDCTRPGGSVMETGNEGTLNGTVMNPFSFSFGALGDVPMEPTPAQSSTSTCQPESPVTAICNPSEFLKRFEKAEAELERSHGVLNSDLSYRKFTLTPAAIQAQQADVCIGRRANRTHQDGRTLLPGLPLSPNNPKDASPGRPTLRSHGERSYDSLSNRDVQTSPSTPEQMMIEGPTDEATLGRRMRTRIRDWGSWGGAAWWKWILVTFVGCWLMFAIGAALGIKKGIGACKPN